MGTSRYNSCALDIVESLKDESGYNLDEDQLTETPNDQDLGLSKAANKSTVLYRGLTASCGYTRLSSVSLHGWLFWT